MRGWKRWRKPLLCSARGCRGSGIQLDPWRIDAELKRLVEMRTGWDEVFGHLAMLFKQSRAWEPLGFASFGHYCEEGLGMAERTVAQRVALERSLYRIPPLRRALREKRISYEKARLIARHAEGEEVQGWIEKAVTMTCVELRRALQQKDETQMCARGTFNIKPRWECRAVVLAARVNHRRIAEHPHALGDRLGRQRRRLDHWRPTDARPRAGERMAPLPGPFGME